MPLASYMRAVLKNNEGIKRKKKNKFKEKTLTETGQLDFTHLPKATPLELNNIKTSIKKENFKKTVIRVLVFFLAILLLVFILIKMN